MTNWKINFLKDLPFIQSFSFYRASVRQSLTHSSLNHSYLRVFRVGWAADWAGSKQAATRHSRTQSDSMGDLARSISRSMNVLHTHVTTRPQAISILTHDPATHTLHCAAAHLNFPISMSIFMSILSSKVFRALRTLFRLFFDWMPHTNICGSGLLIELVELGNRKSRENRRRAARGRRWFWPMCDNYTDFCRSGRFEASTQSSQPQERISGRREGCGLPVRHFFFESLLAVRKQTVHCTISTAQHSSFFFSVANACSNIGTVFSIINACGNYQAQFGPRRLW